MVKVNSDALLYFGKRYHAAAGGRWEFNLRIMIVVVCVGCCGFSATRKNSDEKN
jgi:hypothetical protein